MDDDIVTRLHENCGCYAAEEFGYNCTNCDAADEIERLRADLDKASALISKLAELLVPFSSLMNKHEQGMLIKAVRGE